jgi:hypothetical protein
MKHIKLTLLFFLLILSKSYGQRGWDSFPFVYQSLNTEADYLVTIYEEHNLLKADVKIHLKKGRDTFKLEMICLGKKVHDETYNFQFDSGSQLLGVLLGYQTALTLLNVKKPGDYGVYFQGSVQKIKFPYIGHLPPPGW